MVGSGNKIAIAYLVMLQNIKGALLLRKIEIPSRFENIRIDSVAVPHMLNGSPHYATLKCEDPCTANQIQLE